MTKSHDSYTIRVRVLMRNGKPVYYTFTDSRAPSWPEMP